MVILHTQKPDNLVGLSPIGDTESPANRSPPSSSKSTPNKPPIYDMRDSRRNSISKRDNASAPKSFPVRNQAGDLFSAAVGGCQLPPVRSQILVNNAREKKIFIS